MKFVEVDKTPFTVGDNVIVGFKIKPIGLFEFCTLLETVANDVSDEPVSKRLHRARMVHQVVCVDKTKKEHTFDGLTLLTLPACYAMSLHRAITESPEGRAKILATGDGISTPIHYQLAQPVKLADGTDLTEIEIQAKTYNDIEGIILEDMGFLQVREMLSTCATPVWTGDQGATLQAIPYSTLEQISIVDGAFLVNNVLPGFLE